MDHPYPNTESCPLSALEYVKDEFGETPFRPGGIVSGYVYVIAPVDCPTVPTDICGFTASLPPRNGSLLVASAIAGARPSVKIIPNIINLFTVASPEFTDTDSRKKKLFLIMSEVLKISGLGSQGPLAPIISNFVSCHPLGLCLNGLQ